MPLAEVKIEDLLGKALDWAVASIEGLPICHDPMAFGNNANGGYWVWEEKPMGVKLKIGPHRAPASREAAAHYSPSTNWDQLGPLLLSYPIVLGNHESGEEDGKFWGSAHCFISGTSFDTTKGMMVAACRAIVAFKLEALVMMVPFSLVQTAA
ncbi:hypothetical protein PS865_04406 [Pseudomonas fluorescens]|uniref:phage protein NinX family protein n=1 Tax=Pseudomonas fluorescens TaxID=294 RepID=UPI0012428819|nr:phage protein NinX family protein [Pseudomonas fluorescens]VVP31925.1 hypothetical protein PS865_04406 [Pseudomonas fluorescens]